MKNLPVSRFMTRPLLTVPPDESLASALTLMEARNVHHLLVVENGRMAGILSSADLLKLCLLRTPGETSCAAGESMGLAVRDVMQSRVAVVRDTSTLQEIARALSVGGLHALPVLALDDTPVGIVTSSDLIGILIDQIERDDPSPQAVPQGDAHAALPRLLETLRAAEIYLHSGQSSQQHARLSLAVARARESIGHQDTPLIAAAG